MQESKREFIKKVGFLGAGGMFAGLSSINGQPIRAGAENSSVFNVKDFGAKGDGIASDSAAIQKALDAAGEVQGVAYFPSGNYRCHDLKVHSHTMVLAEPKWAYGPDADAVLTIDNDNANCVLDITDGIGIHIRGISLRGNPEASKIQHGIFQNNVEKRWVDSIPVIDEVSVQSFSGNGVYFIKGKIMIIRRSIFKNNQGHGVSIHDGGDGFVMDNQFSENGKCGFKTEDSGASIAFTANRLDRNGEYGLYLSGGANWHHTNIGMSGWSVTGNSFDGNGGAAVYANRLIFCTFTGNVFSRNGRNASGLTEGTAESCHLLIQNCKGITVTGNTGWAGRNDDGSGALTPNYAFRFTNNSCSVIAANAFSEGYVTDMYVNKGSAFPSDFQFVNNIGSPRS